MKYWSISSSILVEEAKKLGLKAEIISKNKNTFYIKGNGKEVLFKSTDFGGNSSLGTKLGNDKELAYNILEKNNLPIAKSYYLSKGNFNDFDFSQINDLNFPLIIKPIDQGHGHGVMMKILTIKELKAKLNISFQKYNNMIIQEEIKGDEIRVLITKGKLVLACCRTPASVVGDGKRSIKQLIKNENNSNPHRGEGYKKPLAFIKIDNELLSFIDKQNLSEDTIPKNGANIQLRGNSNIGTGGTIIDVTKLISNDIKNKCIKICKIFGFEICGIDVLTTDMTKSLKESGGIILELNATPGLGGDKELTNVNSGKEILKLIFC